MNHFSFKSLSIKDKAFMLFVYLTLAIIFLFVLYPLIFVVSSSFSSTQAVVAGRVWLWPVDFSLKGYEAVFSNRNIWIGYYNSLLITFMGTLICITFTMMVAYPLSRSEFSAKGIITLLITITMFFGGGLIPNFILIQNLKLFNTRWAIILPPAVQAWYIIMTRTYIKSTIPPDLSDSARLDGCDDIRFLVRIVVPLSKPIIAVITLYAAVTFWNSFFTAMIYLRDQKLYPLQIVLRNILILNQFDTELFNRMSDKEIIERQQLMFLLKYSLIVVASVPVMLIYPFVQKHFVKGIMIGSIKG